MGLTMTMPNFLANRERNWVEGPSSALSANSHHGCFSRVQNAKGIAANDAHATLRGVLSGYHISYKLLLLKVYQYQTKKFVCLHLHMACKDIKLLQMSADISW